MARCLKCKGKMDGCKRGMIGAQIFCGPCRRSPTFTKWLGTERAERLLTPLVQNGTIPAGEAVELRPGLRIVAGA